MRAVFRESGCLGVQPKRGGIRHPRLNISERPIANKYCEGKLKSTLERESNEHVKLLAGKRWASVRTRVGTGLRRWSAAVHDVHGRGAAGAGCTPTRVGQHRLRPPHNGRACCASAWRARCGAADTTEECRATARRLRVRGWRGGQEQQRAGATASPFHSRAPSAPYRCWRNGVHRPVLKHGPRSLARARVFGWQARTRNESDTCPRRKLQGRPVQAPLGNGLSRSVCARTR